MRFYKLKTVTFPNTYIASAIVGSDSGRFSCSCCHSLTPTNLNQIRRKLHPKSGVVVYNCVAVYTSTRNKSFCNLIKELDSLESELCDCL